MGLLCRAQWMMAVRPFERWRGTLGFGTTGGGCELRRARRLAAQVERAAWRLPFATKCLPRAMALSWMLRRRQIAHTVVIAVRPSDRRDAPDALHAWVEIAGARIIGDLPGPWIETLRLGV